MSDWATSLPAFVTLVLSVATIAIYIVALGVLPGGRRPQTAMAWLLLIFMIPWGGFLLFLLFGRTSVGKKRREEQAEVNAAILVAAQLERIGDDVARAQLPPLVQTFAHLNSNLGVLPALLRQHRRADPGLRRLDRGDDAGGRRPPSTTSTWSSTSPPGTR